MTGVQFCMLMVILFGLVTVPGLLLFLLTYDWGRAERIEEALKYDPAPAPVTRFCTAEEMRERGW